LTLLAPLAKVPRSTLTLLTPLTKVPRSTLTLLTPLAKVPRSTLALLTLRTIVTIKTIFTSVANISVSVTTIFLPISIGIPRRITLRAIQFPITIGIVILQNTFFFCSFRSLLFFGSKFPITISIKFIEHFLSTRLLIPIFLLELLAGLPGGFFFCLIKSSITIGVKFFQDFRLAGSLSLLAIKFSIAIGVKFFKQPCPFGLPSVLGLAVFGPTHFDQTISQRTRC
jgi:hypothetical protein